MDPPVRPHITCMQNVGVCAALTACMARYEQAVDLIQLFCAQLQCPHWLMRQYHSLNESTFPIDIPGPLH